MIMNNLKTNEMNLVRSRALAVLFSMLIGALIMLPIFSSAKNGNKPTKSKAKTEITNSNYLSAVTIASFNEGNFTMSIDNKVGESVYRNEVSHTSENLMEVFDLTKLKDGEYTLKIESEGKTQIRFFTLDNGNIKAYGDSSTESDFEPAINKAVFIMLNSSNIYTFKY